MVSAWRSLPEVLPDETGSGLVMDWQQNSGSLIVSGDVKSIKIWDAERELCVAVNTLRSFVIVYSTRILLPKLRT